MSTRKRVSWAGLALVALGVLGGAAAEPLTAPGITEAIADVNLSPSVAGIVSVWKFKEGDFVKENEPIVELDKNLE